MTLRWGDYLGLSGQAQPNHISPLKAENLFRLWRERENENENENERRVEERCDVISNGSVMLLA